MSRSSFGGSGSTRLYLQDVVQGAVGGGCCDVRLSTMPSRRRVHDDPDHVGLSRDKIRVPGSDRTRIRHTTPPLLTKLPPNRITLRLLLIGVSCFSIVYPCQKFAAVLHSSLQFRPHAVHVTYALLSSIYPASFLGNLKAGLTA